MISNDIDDVVDDIEDIQPILMTSNYIDDDDDVN
jgi:hypothetical protein